MGMELTAETKYRLLTRISHEIRDTLDLDEILNHLLDMVHSVLDYDAAGIFVLNQDLVHPHGKRPRELIAGIVRRGFDYHPPGSDPMLNLGLGIVGHVIRTSESVVAHDVRKDSRYIEGRKGTLSQITVPVLRNDRAIGALNIESDKLAAYSDSDVEVLRFFADAAAISIEKAMLHRQILDSKLIEEQLRLAQHVQSRLLPGRDPEIPGYDIAGICISTYEIGGDYFDYLHLPDGGIGIVVADVSGKGVPAALIMAAFRALLRTQTRIDPEPARIASSLRRLLPDFTGEANFVTSVYGVLNPADGRFTYTNCGHEPPILFRAGGGIEKLGIGGPLLSGVLEGVSYRTFEVTLAPGDLLLLYTDGVVEVMKEEEEEEEFGVTRLERVVQRFLHLPVSEIIGEIIRATREFAGSENYEDDFTLVIVGRKPAPSS
jgi:sigma-B regulation protein RsbU (phosphoserine phosphatase)